MTACLSQAIGQARSTTRIRRAGLLRRRRRIVVRRPASSLSDNTTLCCTFVESCSRRRPTPRVDASFVKVVSGAESATHRCLVSFLSAPQGTKVCRYNWHSAGSLGWQFAVLKYKYIFQIKHTEAILSNTTRKLLRFEISKMLIAVLKNKLSGLTVIIFGTLSFPIKAKFHYTGPRGPARTRADPHGLCRRPARTQRSFSETPAAKKVRAGPVGSGRLQQGAAVS